MVEIEPKTFRSEARSITSLRFDPYDTFFIVNVLRVSECEGFTITTILSSYLSFIV